MKPINLLPLLGITLLTTNAFAQASAISARRPVLTPTTPVVFNPDRLSTTIVRPRVVRAVRTRLAPINPAQFGPSSKFTVGLYDENGDVDGEKILTGKELFVELDNFTNEHKRTFSLRSRSLNPEMRGNFSRLKLPTAVLEKKEWDAELKEQIEVVEIPQDLNDSQDLVLQHGRLIAIPARPIIIARPIVFRPTPSQPTHNPSPYSKSIGYDQTWGKKDKFAAFIDAELTAYGSRQKRVASGSFKAGGQVFGKTMNLIEFSTNVDKRDNSNTGHTIFKVLGQVKWENSSSNPNKSLVFTREESKRQRFWVGPLPVSVGGAIGGSIGMNLNLHAPNGFSVAGQVKPYIDSYGAADAAIDVWLARAGIEGKLRIVKDTIDGQVRLTYNDQKKNLDFKLEVDNTLKALDGKVSVYAKIRKLFGGWKKWSQTILTWSGFEKTWKLIDAESVVNI